MPYPSSEPHLLVAHEEGLLEGGRPAVQCKLILYGEDHYAGVPSHRVGAAAEKIWHSYIFSLGLIYPVSLPFAMVFHFPKHNFPCFCTKCFK